MDLFSCFCHANVIIISYQIDDEPFNPDYVEVDRVLDVSTGVDQATGAVSISLVTESIWCHSKQIVQVFNAM